MGLQDGRSPQRPRGQARSHKAMSKNTQWQLRPSPALPCWGHSCADTFWKGEACSAKGFGSKLQSSQCSLRTLRKVGR